MDQSNTENDDVATILPRDPDASARHLCAALGCGAVLVTDTFGRPWREGLMDVAIGVAGLAPLERIIEGPQTGEAGSCRPRLSRLQINLPRRRA